MRPKASPHGVWLVVPCYHESERIAPFVADLARTFSDAEGVRVLLVEDGSGTAEQARFMQAVQPVIAGRALFAQPLLLSENLGKGGAVYAGWAQHGGQEWLAFVDADGSCSAGETRRVLELARSTLPDATGDLPSVAFFASRVKMLGRTVTRHLHRHLIGRVYATLVSELLHIPVYDSQCGLKVVPRAAWQVLQPVLQQRGFAFDAELLAALLDGGVRVLEVPVDWHETRGGKVRLWRDSWRMFRDILAIRHVRASAGWQAAVAQLHNPLPSAALRG